MMQLLYVVNQEYYYTIYKIYMDILITNVLSLEHNEKEWNERAVFGPFSVYTREVAHVNHFHSELIENGKILAIWFGSLYETCSILEMHTRALDNTLFDTDGSFLYAEIDSEGGLKLYSEREGLIPIYYRQGDKGIEICTRQDIIQKDGEADIDYSAVWDYLRYGLLIGSHTLSNSVRLLQGGSRLTFSSNEVIIEKIRFFHHDASKEEYDIPKLMNELGDAFVAGIKKRIDRPSEEISIFLSGGMDSRMVLAAGNLVDNTAFKATSFGQPGCEEVDVARKVAEVNDNQFYAIDLQPKDHLEDAVEYARLTNGSDMSAQSYIINAAKKIREHGITAFMTGSFLECHIGGTFLPETALTTTQKLSEYLPQNMKNVKCELFPETELMDLLVPGIYEQLFKGKTSNLIDEARQYDTFLVKDIIQSFIIDNRDKRLVLNREIVPSQSLDYINPCFDKDFLEIASRIPAEKRFKRKFYRDFFIEKYPAYADVCYNNTTLPVSAPFELWAEGSKNEYNREQIYVQLMQNGRKTYYPHFYSDMDGYSRYDETWKAFFNEMLLSSKSAFIGKIVRRDKIELMLSDHKCCKANYRKKLLNLASMELYFRLVQKK